MTTMGGDHHEDLEIQPLQRRQGAGAVGVSLISDDVFFDMAFAPQRGFHHLFLGQMLINQIGF